MGGLLDFVRFREFSSGVQVGSELLVGVNSFWFHSLDLGSRHSQVLVVSGFGFCHFHVWIFS